MEVPMGSRIRAISNVKPPLPGFCRWGGFLPSDKTFRLVLYTIMVYKNVMAEKRKPTYDLEAFKATYATVDRLAVTGTALRSASALGIGRTEIVNTVQAMQRGHFCKSMTAYAAPRLWQDFYHVPSPVGVLYVKFTADAITEFLLLSFKEKDND
jgi:motility quorum-sensing regulator/GCU-specific mRNA interferase toxin